MSPMMIPIVACMIPMVVAPTAIICQHQRRKREWEHRERMKALEMGHALPGGHAWPAAAAIAIGAGVPIGSFFFSWMAVLTAHAGDEVFIAPMLVSLVAVPGGIGLAKRMMAPRRSSDDAADLANGKPYQHDPDAYDVVGRRG